METTKDYLEHLHERLEVEIGGVRDCSLITENTNGATLTKIECENGYRWVIEGETGEFALITEDIEEAEEYWDKF